MTIDSIDTLKMILEEAREALAVVADKHGLVLERKHCTYSSTEAPVAFKFVVPQRTENGEAIDPKETAFKHLAPAFGLEPDDYGKKFRTFNGVYLVCGIKPKARKYPVLDIQVPPRHREGRSQGTKGLVPSELRLGGPLLQTCRHLGRRHNSR